MDFKKYIPSGTFLIMILCFLLPFFVVKCNGEEIMNIKGHHYLGIGSLSIKKSDTSFLGIEVSENKENSEKENSEIKEKTNVKFNIFAFILFMILLFGIFFGTSKIMKKDIFNGKISQNLFNKIFFGLSITSLLFIIIFILDLKFDSKNELSKEMEKVISINLGSGLSFLILLSILNSIYFGFELGFFDKYLKKFKENKNIEKIEEKN